VERLENTKRGVLNWRPRRVFQGGTVNNVKGFQEKDEHRQVPIGFSSAELISNHPKGEWWELTQG